jgi:hypothetical protein
MGGSKNGRLARQGRGAGGNVATTASALTPSQQIVNVAKATGMTGMQKLQMAAGLGLLGSGVFGNRAGQAEEIYQAGDDARADQLMNELAAEQEVKRKAYLDETRSKINARRAETVAKLQGRLGEQTRLELPSILEDLNSRGLLTSESAVANAMAQRQAQNTLTVQDFERTQAAQDAALEDQISQDILEGRLGMEQAALQRQFSLQDTEAEARLAQELAKRRAKAERDAALIQGGTTLLASTLLR